MQKLLFSVSGIETWDADIIENVGQLVLCALLSLKLVDAISDKIQCLFILY